MSVTVADLMKLPSLRKAKVLGGKGGLGKVVSSISVLESTDTEVLNDSIFHNSEYYGSEIVITGFLNAREDIECQMNNIRRLAEGGEVGLILFYVGAFMPRVDKQLIEFADREDFVLISMPEKRVDLRYSEVICEVMEAILKDHMLNPSIVGEILERVSRLPQHQRTVETTIKMLSDRLQATVILQDAARHTLNIAVWPRISEARILQQLKARTITPTKGVPMVWDGLPDSTLCTSTLSVGSGQKLTLILIKEGEPLQQAVFEQAEEIVQLAINIWSEQHDEVAIHELFKAILRDEPMKMRRLAEIFHIDIASVHEMWIIDGVFPKGVSTLKKLVDNALQLLSASCAITVGDLYENRGILFCSDFPSLEEAEAVILALQQQAQAAGSDVFLIRCSGLLNTTEVRQAYLAECGHLDDARKIYPGRHFFDLMEIRYAQECRELIEQGEESLHRCMKEFELLRDKNGGSALCDTLSVYYLDGEYNVALTAEKLFVHKNTVKYRLHCIGDLLGFRPDKMPQSQRLYRAAAIRRLLY